VKHKELKVGLFSAVCLVLLYFGFNYLKGIDFFASKKTYYAVYDNINQLGISNPVLVNGYAVGRVSHIKILQQKNNHVLVELEIDSDIALTDDTKAILNSELLGGKSVLLKIGHSKNILNAADTVKTEVAKGMFDMFSETATPVATDLQTTLRKFNEAIDNLNGNFKKLDGIFTKLQSTPDLLNKTLVTANGRIEDISTNFKTDTEKISATLDELKPTLANLKTLSDSLKHIQLNKTLVKVQTTLTSLSETLAKTRKNNNTVGRLLTEDSLYVNLNKLLVSLNKLSDHINSNPKHFMGPLGQSKKKVDRDLRRQEEEKKKATEAQKK